MCHIRRHTTLSFSMFDRAATAAVIFPMGRVSGDVTVAGRTFSQSANGFGDPMLEFKPEFFRTTRATHAC